MERECSRHRQRRRALVLHACEWPLQVQRQLDPVDGDDIGKIDSVGFPSELSTKSINHFGDPDHYRGYIFMPFEGPETVKSVIAVFRASDLAFVDWIDVTPHQVKAGWVAIDPVARTLYTSVDRLVAGTPLLRYQIDVAKIENGIQGDFLTPTTPAAVLDHDGMVTVSPTPMNRHAVPARVMRTAARRMPMPITSPTAAIWMTTTTASQTRVMPALRLHLTWAPSNTRLAIQALRTFY